MSNEPHCPHCKAQMFPHRYRTLVGFTQAWSCACLDIPGLEQMPPVDVCLADLLSLRLMGMPDYQFGSDRVPHREMVKIGDRLTRPKTEDWQSETCMIVKRIVLIEDAECWEAHITYVHVHSDGSESVPWNIRMCDAQRENWVIMPRTEDN